MLFRRIASALRRQDWVTVIIEFALVISSVLIALQVNNWNEARANKKGALSALNRLHGEVVANIAALDNRMDLINENNAARADGLSALRRCDASPEASQALSQSLGLLTADIVPSFVDNTLHELARRDQYLDLLSHDFRRALNRYSGQLTDERDQLRTNFKLLWDEHVINHPSVGVEFAGADVRQFSFVFKQPISNLCQDPAFQRKFAMTEGWHQSAVLRMQRFKESNALFLDEIEAELAALR